MTVEELIKKLGQYPPNVNVYVNGYEFGLEDVQEIEIVYVKRDENTEWGSMGGPHDQKFDKQGADDQGILIARKT